MQQQAGKSAPTLLQHRPLLLLLLLLWSLTGTLACNTAPDMVVLQEKQQHTFPNENDDLPLEMTLFVKRESSSAGFAVHVSGSDGTEHTAWFPAGEEYFPDTDIWYQLLVHAQINTENSAVEFSFETREGKWTCESLNAPQGLNSMSVVAHGTSCWTTNFPPKDCYKTLAILPKHYKLPTCKPEPKPDPEPQHHTSTPESEPEHHIPTPEPEPERHIPTPEPEPEHHIPTPEHESPAGMSAGEIAWLCVGLLVGALVVGGVVLYITEERIPWRKTYTAASQSD